MENSLPTGMASWNCQVQLDCPIEVHHSSWILVHSICDPFASKWYIQLDQLTFFDWVKQ